MSLTTTNQDNTSLTTNEPETAVSLTQNATLYRTTGPTTIEHLLVLELRRVQVMRGNLRFDLHTSDNRGALGYVNDQELLKARETSVMELLCTGVLKGLFTSFLLHVSAVKLYSEENVKAVVEWNKTTRAKEEEETLETIQNESIAYKRSEETYHMLQIKMKECEFEGKQPIVELVTERRFSFSNEFKTELLDMLDEYERNATCYRILDEGEDE
jgi:hypothetical protein